MDKTASDGRREIGAVKAVVSMFGERLSDGTRQQSNTGYTAEPPSRTKDLHMAKRDMAKYRGRQRSADSVKILAESELSQAKRAVKDLASQIEESNAKLISRKKDMEEEEEESPNPPTTTPVSAAEEESASIKSADYLRVMKELEFVKKELSKLKLGMATIMGEKLEAEKTSQQSNAAEAAIRKEIEEANEEQVLVELATIEALKEKQDIESRREKETSEFSAKAEETRKKINEALEEIESSKEVESQLAVTLYDAAVLQNELKQARVMERKIQRRGVGGSFGSSASSSSKRREEGSGGSGSSLLKSITKELEDAKKELESVKEEGIQFMSSMDIIRNELNHVKEEANRLKKAEEKTDSTVQNLKSKLLKGKSKLEAAISAEEKAKSVASNLSLTLQQLETEAEIAKKEKDIIGEETEKIKAEIQKTETEIDITEEKLEAAMEEFETIKAKEASTMKNLQILVEEAMDARESALKEGNSTIHLSRFEYDYLNERAAKAEEIADLKVAAAQAWIEALKASEKEILMKVDIAHRELRETKVEEERSIVAMNTAAAQGDATDLKQQHRRRSNVGGRKRSGSETPRRIARASSSGTPTRMRLKLRNTEFSPSRTTTRSASVPMKKKSPMPNLSMMLKPQENR